ncbi:hypothetical protein BaRGS_00022663 [Batillaria attramentaria]|uniref:Carboxylic ester hydrolase n=1 Tax=Batillaria attramentaria TaxID=370345 RepID=A0ABD0KG25_9CAEN
MWTLCVLFTLLLCHVTSPAPVIPAPWGSIQGFDMEGRGGRRLSGYLGIPYARPPTGELRWQKPHPHPGPGEGNVFMADTFAPACPQELPGLGGVTAGVSEDCLTLNVYVPTTVDSPRPVMVFIHGGALFMGEAAMYRPFKLVADGDVIVVTIQYRLGALGFLSTGDDTLPGNLGLWDQNLALRWVKDNIRAFGGDDEVVTLFGESAGSWSTGLQIVSPYSKGLFHRAILQSGSPITSVYFALDERKSFEGISRALDCESDTDQKTLECLKTRSADVIVAKTTEWSKESGEMIPVAARIDGDFIPRDPLELVQDEDYVQANGIGDIDVIAGLNNKDGAVVALFGTSPDSLTNQAVFRAVVDKLVKLMNKRTPEDVVSTDEANDDENDVIPQVVEFFYKRDVIGTNTAVSVETVINIHGDALFFAPTIQWLRPLVSQSHQGARYLYLLEHDFYFNREGIPGTHHADELFIEFDVQTSEGSLFQLAGKSTEACNEEDDRMSDMFVDVVTSFAKTGNPSGPLRTALGGDWPEFTSEDEACLSLSLTPQVRRDVMRDRMALWLQLVPQIVSATQRQQKQPPPDNSTRDEL